ncbi:ankyrin repeat-containing domain protein [Russula earlei]|uniref:Ankyrin repeat-containing domain protein n=1 Tax=Russula earlei TaxID=71964 RepID=A0ACC0TWB5_9AGAM|nr:ankyrin repeat-containing domain protein [Russula earlei]
MNKASQTAAELASEHDHGEISRFLAEYKSGEMSQTNLSLNTADDDADEESKDKANASLITASDEGEFDVVESLLEQGADVNARNEDFETPLELAAKKGELKVVRGWTPLHDASLEGNFEISKVLVDHGANVNARTIDHWTPLHLSAYNGNLEIAELLLERGADVHALTDEGRTAYELSLEDGSRNIADLLQKHKARAL